MRKKLAASACCFILLFEIVLPAYSIGSTDQTSSKKVLVAHSYHPQYEWVFPISRGIKRVFEQAKNVQVETSIWIQKLKPRKNGKRNCNV